MTTPKTRIAVLVSGGGTNLQALIDFASAGKLAHGELVAVISSSRDAYALTRASTAGIRTYVASRKESASQADFENALSAYLAESGAEFIVLAGFMSILSADITSKWRDRIINVHPALIPSFCGKGFYGLRVHEAALERGVKLTGATVHYVNEIPDGGRIIRQKAVEVKDGDTPQSLQQRVMREAEWIILPEATEEVAKLIFDNKKQEENV